MEDSLRVRWERAYFELFAFIIIRLLRIESLFNGHFVWLTFDGYLPIKSTDHSRPIKSENFVLYH